MERCLACEADSVGACGGSRLLAHAHLVNAGFKNVRANNGWVKAVPYGLASEAALQCIGLASEARAPQWV